MIGYLALARETFDVEYAESKFEKAKSLLLSLEPDAIGFNDLVTNEVVLKAPYLFLKVIILKKFFSFKQPLLTLSFS